METTEKKFFNDEILKKVREFYSMKELHSVMARNQIVWSWGAHGWTNVEKKALRFRVSGNHFKGLIFIVVNGADLFDVYLTKGAKLEIVDTLNDVFIEDLIPTIDERVERLPEYRF